jgi:hypothetical protein
MMVTKEPKVSPKPFWIVLAKSGSGIPNITPADKLINKKATNELTFKKVIKKTKSKMQIMTMKIDIGF